MKLTNLIATGMVVLAGLVSAQAQLGFDAFNSARTYILAAPQNIGAGSGIVTNSNLDSLLPIGIASVDLVVATNTGTTGGTLTFTLQTSPDQTNWTSVPNIQFINSTTSIGLTNGYYNYTNPLTATDLVLLPGTVTTPNASQAGFTTSYLTKLPATNSGALTVSTTGNYKLGFNIKDNFRYLRTVWTPGGTVTNYTVSATLTSNVQ